MKNFKRRFLWLLGLLVLGALVWGVVEYHRRKWRLEAYKAELVKQGVEFDLAKHIPPVPSDEENAAIILQQAIYALRAAPLNNINVADPMKAMGPGRAQVEWRQPQPDGQNTPATWAQLAQAVAANETLLDQIRAAARRPHLNFKLDYYQGYSLLLPHLAKVKQVSQWFAASALLKLRAGDTSGAIAEVESALLLANLQREEPLLISQLVAIAVASIMLEVTWEVLQADGLAEPDLARLQTVWERSEWGDGLGRATELELASTVKLIRDIRSSTKARQDFTSIFGASGSVAAPVKLKTWGEWVGYLGEVIKGSAISAGEGIKMLHWRYLGSYNDEWIYLQQTKAQLDLLLAFNTGTPANEVLPEYIQQHDALSRLSRTEGSAFAGIFGVAGRTPEKVIQNESYRRLAETAIALKRYQIKHGEWPEELAVLVPEFLATVPTDPADGQPLRYARKENREFLLYALGTNHRDDGGDPNREKMNDNQSFHLGKDWVWPMPVSAVVNQ